MPSRPSNLLTATQATTRARWMIESGHKLSQAAAAVYETRNSSTRSAAEELKEEQLLSYRVATVPDELTPVLEALMLAADRPRD